jgi:hypothetical protein
LICVQGYCFSMKRKGIKYFAAVIAFYCISFGVSAKPGAGTQPPPIDIVFCVDLSGSTNGIIEHLRNNLWHFVHELELLQPVPDYRIGFVGFSRPSFGKDFSYVKIIRNLSYDLEWLSNEMFSLRSQVEQGNQFVGAALMTCAKSMNWSEDPNAIKLVFLAGNGFVNSDGDLYKKACELLAGKGIVVNALYWQSYTLPKELWGWREIPNYTGGQFFSVDVSYNETASDTGFDSEKLMELNEALNRTYVYYGNLGKLRYKMMAEQDRKIYEESNRGFRYRMMYKISPKYQKKNSAWDLVDFSDKAYLELKDFDPKQLPDSLQEMRSGEFNAYVEKKKLERFKIVVEIRKMLEKREQLEEQAMKQFLEDSKQSRLQYQEQKKPRIDNLILLLTLQAAQAKGYRVR